MPPKKERPVPLSDSIFGGRLAPVHDGEIPVHNTFIQFQLPPPGITPEKKHLATAPAWIGPESFQSNMEATMAQHLEAWLDSADAQDESREAAATAAEGSSGGAAGAVADELPPRDLDGLPPLYSPKKVPVGPLEMRYQLPTVGLDGSSSVGGVRCLEPDADDFTLDDGGPAPRMSPKNESAGADGDEDADEARVLGPPVPLGDLPSIGSAQHHEGQCKRCCFFPKGRCLNGYNCEFCHLEHEKRKRKKKKKGRGGKDGDISESDDDDEDKPLQATASDDHAALTAVAVALAGSQDGPERHSPGLPLQHLPHGLGFDFAAGTGAAFSSAWAEPPPWSADYGAIGQPCSPPPPTAPPPPMPPRGLQHPGGAIAPAGTSDQLPLYGAAEVEADMLRREQQAAAAHAQAAAAAAYYGMGYADAGAQAAHAAAIAGYPSSLYDPYAMVDPYMQWSPYGALPPPVVGPPSLLPAAPLGAPGAPPAAALPAGSRPPPR